MDAKHVLLRIEGQNLANFVFDTNDLSTARGGGLLLLGIADALENDAVENRKPVWRAVFRQDPVQKLIVAGSPKRISSGASIALFEAELAAKATADQLRCAVEAAFATHPALKYATLAVDVEPCAGDAGFREARERVVLANRRRQLRASSVVVALDPFPSADEKPADGDYEIAPPANTVCDIDGVDSAVVAQRMKDRRYHPIGRSTRARRAEGNDAKRQRFYQTYSGGKEAPPHYSWDFEQLACNAPQGLSRLEGKMAVLYIDGNKFSGKQESALQKAGKAGQTAAQRSFDKQVQDHRRNVLGGLLDLMMATNEKPATWGGASGSREAPPGGISPWFNWVNRHFDYEDGRLDSYGRRGRFGWGAVLRFETLLWGGDELLWVMPAWKGWEVLTRFYDEKWEIKNLDGTALPLTHAAGLVFCHYNAPIRRIKDLAQSLAELCKDQDAADSKKQRKKIETNRIACQVLESFDLVSGDIAQYRKDFTPEGIDPAELLLKAEHLSQIEKLVRDLKELGMSNRQLHSLGSMMRSGVPATLVARSAGDENTLEYTRKVRCRVTKLLGTGNAGWHHLIDLWDYIAPDAQTGRSVANNDRRDRGDPLPVIAKSVADAQRENML